MINNKLKVAVIGTGNIGCDLMVKIMRSPYLTCSLMAGRNYDSVGSRFALRHRVNVSDQSIEAIRHNPDICDIVCDATSSAVHQENAPLLRKLNKFTIDLTPARVGTMCVPVLNLADAVSSDNVNMITCGGQASIPIAYALSQVHPEASYIEMVSTIASKSAGPGTRNNIDEFTQTTKDALAFFTHIPGMKAIITLNPAIPPINMRTTLYALITKPNIDAIRQRVFAMTEQVQKYVPGYRLLTEPTLENGRIIITIEVTGLGDYLPSYAGNLDIITCAALRIAEAYARKQGVTV